MPTGPTPVVNRFAQEFKAVIKARQSIWELELDIIRDAREAGYSWEAIGELSGLSRQGAIKRYQSTHCRDSYLPSKEREMMPLWFMMLIVLGPFVP